MDPDMPDATLVEETLRGNRAAYGALATRYRSAMIRTAAAVAGPSEAEDVVQDVLLRAYAGLGRLRDPSAVGPWLLTAVRHGALDVRRKGAREAGVPSPRADAPAGDIAGERAERIGRLREAVERLPEAYRAVVSLRHTQGLPCAGIARILGEPVGTVTSKLCRAYEMLREGMSGERGDEAAEGLHAV